MWQMFDTNLSINIFYRIGDLDLQREVIRDVQVRRECNESECMQHVLGITGRRDAVSVAKLAVHSN